MTCSHRTAMLAIWLAAFVVLLHDASRAQTCTGDACNSNDCTDGSVNDTNLMDLGTGFYGRLQGGLYPNGSNVRPMSHNDAGLEFSDAVAPLDPNGVEDLINGKIVLLSIGFSNAQAEFCYFKDKVAGMDQRNPYLVVVNGAIAGWPIEEIIDPAINAEYWAAVHEMLEAEGVQESQVQAIWFKTANLGPESTMVNGFIDYINSLRNQYAEGMALLQEKFPNNRLCYLSDRIYGGYSDDIANPEPFAYWTGWAIKRLIQKQLSGDLPYDGDNPVSPWLSWGPYLWADGTSNRIVDNLEWLCTDFREDDRRHPSDCGKDKVSDLLIDFFSTDETTKPWFSRTKLIDAGSSTGYVTIARDRFLPDVFFRGGTARATSGAISGTEDDGLYQTFREGTGGNGGFQYDIALPNSGSGVYRITLHFQDPVATGAGQRVFDIRCEGLIKENDFDIYREAGAPLTAHTLWFDQGVSDELLTIRFNPQGGALKPLVCAIEIDFRPPARIDNDANPTIEVPPETVLLEQNYPNPFNPATTIRYSVPAASFVSIRIFDILGREVETLLSERREKGSYAVEWDATEHPSGVYFCVIEAGTFREAKKLIMLK